jgi:hypothetical protein
MANVVLVALLSCCNNQGQIHQKNNKIIHTAYPAHIHRAIDYISGYCRKKEFTKSKNNFRKWHSASVLPMRRNPIEDSTLQDPRALWQYISISILEYIRDTRMENQ